MKAAHFLAFLLVTAFATSLSAQNPARTGKDYALFFVITDFDHWQDFPASSAQQVRDIERELKDYYGFITEFVPNPTRRQILDKLNEYGQRSFGQDDQLLVYISTHGHYEEGRIGVLIPKEGKLSDPTYETTIMHPLLEDLVSNIPCRHITLALDACYSGTFEGEKGKPNDQPWEREGDCKTKTTSALQYKSRLYLTSGGKERTPINSQFAAKWLDALQNRNSDGILSHADLVAVVSEATPIPRYGKFKAHESRGDFVFVRKDACKPDMATNLGDEQHWLNVEAKTSKNLLLEHLELFPNCSHYQKALDKLYEIDITIIGKQKLMGMFDFAYIQAGIFEMGSNEGEADEKPVHSVELNSFYITRTEVTFEQFDFFCEMTRRVYPHDMGHERGNRPVINVSWKEAIDFCNWLSENTGREKVYKIEGDKVSANSTANGFRLPTEAEWEYAARSEGSNDKWAGTSKYNRIPAYANFYSEFFNGYHHGDRHPYTTKVKSYRKNDVGLYDMSGNVAEWCWDYFEDYQPSRQINPKGPSKGYQRVVRGGSWASDPKQLRCTSRRGLYPSGKDEEIGFRLALSFY